MSEAKKLARALRRFLPLDCGCLVSWKRSASRRIPRRQEVESHSVKGAGHKSRKAWIYTGKVRKPKAPATEAIATNGAGSAASDQARTLPGSSSPPRSLSRCKISYYVLFFCHVNGSISLHLKEAFHYDGVVFQYKEGVNI